jgi:calcium-dependent protein kinase
MFASEVQILKKLDHPNIIKLYEVYETEKTIYLVTEVCDGGELFYLIVEKKFLSEAQAANIMRQIFSAIAYLHEHNICHRDIKPENILLKEKNNIKSIKLIDFGIAKVFKDKEYEHQPKGTTMYLAPEIINGKYGKEVDNWACGVILYILLCGRPPFYGKKIQSTLSSIKKGIFTFDREPFYKVSN